MKNGQSHGEDKNQVNPAKEKLLTEAFLDSLEADKAKKKGYRLEDYRVAGVDTAYYIKDYVSPPTESLLLQCAN